MSESENLRDILGRPAWYKDAECMKLGLSKDVFFVEGRNSNINLQAKLVCLDCPVRMECLEIGMDEYFGIFGGTSAIDRARLRRAIRRGSTIRKELKRLDKRTRERAEQRGYTKPTCEEEVRYE